MRVLLDNNLSPRLIPLLASQGWDVVHVGQLGLHAAEDTAVLERARSESRILISADTDFGALLAVSRATEPSVILVRRITGRRVEDLARLLVANLPELHIELAAGSVVVLGEESLRIRRLPIA